MALEGSAPEAAIEKEVIDLMSSPSTFGGAPVERIDTHLSHIFLAGDRAYKLKRPITLNFVDFSTAEKRRKACEREVRINKPAAGDVYRGVLPIVRREGRLHLGGDGIAVDWVVEMVRFDRNLEFDRLADAGTLSEAHIVDLAETVAKLHAAAEPRRQFGGVDAVVATIKQIAGALRLVPDRRMPSSMLDRWEILALHEAGSLSRLLNARRRHGCVRHTHGDLHLSNVCLHNGRPMPFDAIEFSDEMATTDVAYDMAFVLMDLLHRDLRDHANAFLNRYLSATRDYSGTRTLPLFISMRAAVRALASALSLDQRTGQASAQTYLEQALQGLLTRTDPRLIAIGGLSGTGKSTVARALATMVAPDCGAVLVRSDVSRKRLFDTPPEEGLPSNAYNPGVTATVQRRMIKDARRALAAGQTVILDATFMREEHRQNCDRLARQTGVRFDGFWLTADPERLARRIKARKRDASDATVEVLANQLTADTGPIAWREINADASPQDVSKRIADALG